MGLVKNGLNAPLGEKLGKPGGCLYAMHEPAYPHGRWALSRARLRKREIAAI